MIERIVAGSFLVIVICVALTLLFIVVLLAMEVFASIMDWFKKDNE